MTQLRSVGPSASATRLLRIALVMILAVASCSEKNDDGEILGTWILESIVVGSTQLDVEGISTRTFAGVPAWVEFDSAGRLFGEGACNDFNGGYSLEGETLRPMAVIASAVACEPGQDIEEALLQQLWSDSIQVTFNANTMVWTTKETTATFSRQS